MSAPAPGAAATPGASLGASFGLSPAQVAQVAMTYGYVAFWIVTSAGVILYNKWILTVWGFDYPITLTMWHMAFCSFVSAVLVRGAAVRTRRAAWHPAQAAAAAAAAPLTAFARLGPCGAQVRTGAVAGVNMTRQLFLGGVVPIGAWPLAPRRVRAAPTPHQGLQG